MWVTLAIFAVLGYSLLVAGSLSFLTVCDIHSSMVGTVSGLLSPASLGTILKTRGRGTFSCPSQSPCHHPQLPFSMATYL